MNKKQLWIFILILLWFIWVFYLMFFYQWGFWMGYEVPWNQLTKTYLKVGDYKIWKQKWFYNICNKDKGCLDWEILWFKEVNTDIYIYININHWSGTSGDIKFYEYRVYKWKKTLFSSSQYDSEVTVNNVSDLPKFWLLSNNNLEFYSENELKNLPQEQVNIFKELEKNPIIKIDGKVY